MSPAEPGEARQRARGFAAGRRCDRGRRVSRFHSAEPPPRSVGFTGLWNMRLSRNNSPKRLLGQGAPRRLRPDEWTDGMDGRMGRGGMGGAVVGRSGRGASGRGAGDDCAGCPVGDGDCAVRFAGAFEVLDVEVSVVAVAEQGEDFDVGEAVVL